MAVLLAAFQVKAVDRITALVAVTNAAGTTNGQTITVNSSVRTWTNNVIVAASQILTNYAAATAKTNLYNQIALNPFASVSLVNVQSTNFNLVATAGAALTVTLSAGWGTVTYSTQVVTALIAVRIPIESEPSAAQRTNIISELQSALAGTRNTNVFYESSPAVANLVGLTNVQTVAGAKSFTNLAGVWSGIISNTPAISGTIKALTNGVIYGSSISNATAIGGNVKNLTNGEYYSPSLHSPTMTNGANYGNAFRSFGSGNGSEQYGLDATATNNFATALGNSALAGGQGSTTIGFSAWGLNNNDSAFGASANALGTNSTAIGANATVNFTYINSTALGQSSTVTRTNQVRLGTATEQVSVPGTLVVNGGAAIVGLVTNLMTTGTNAFSDIAFRRFAITSLANGNNAGIIVGTNTFVEVSGPSAAFTINGITGSPNRDGHYLIIVNQTTFNMTIAHDSGVDATAGNRIYCMTGADRATTGNGAAILIYSAAASRWILISLDP